MFKLREVEDTFEWPVKAKVPAGKGKFETINFTAEYRVLERDRISEAFAADADESLRMKLIEDALINIHGIPVEDEAGNEITDKARRCEMALNHIMLAGPISSAFVEGVTGYRSKN